MRFHTFFNLRPLKKTNFCFSVEGGEKLKEVEDEDEGEPEREFVAADEFDESDIDDIEDMHEGRGYEKFEHFKLTFQILWRSVQKLAWEQSEIRVFESHCLSDVQDEDDTSSSSSSEEDGDGEVKIGGKRAAAVSKKGKKAKRRPRAALEREIETEDGSTQRERITS